MVVNTPNGGDIATSDVGFAGARPVGINAYNEAYQVDAGDCLYKEMAKLNKRKVRVFRIDDEGYIYGTVVKRGSEYFFAGFQGTAYAIRTKSTDNTTLAAITLTVYYTPDYEKELKNLNAFEIEDVLAGLKGVILKKGTTTGTATVIGQCGGEDYTSLFGSDWDETSFVNASGGNPTTVTYDSVANILTFVPIASYRVAPASILSAGDITGIEGLDTLVDLT